MEYGHATTVGNATAAYSLPTDADEAREGLLAVESTGRNVLQELRRTVGLLRSHDEAASVLPAPGFAELADLTQAMREAGLEVELELDAPPPADRGLQLAVYRVVQEALTNCLRHAGPTRVRVTLTGGPEILVRVEDQGRRGPLRAAEAGGNGLRGLRERVAPCTKAPWRLTGRATASWCRHASLSRRNDQGPAGRRPNVGARGFSLCESSSDADGTSPNGSR